MFLAITHFIIRYIPKSMVVTSRLFYGSHSSPGKWRRFTKQPYCPPSGVVPPIQLDAEKNKVPIHIAPPEKTACQEKDIQSGNGFMEKIPHEMPAPA